MPPGARCRLLRAPAQLSVVGPDGGVFRLVQRPVAGGDGVVRLALEDGEMLGLRRDQRDRLDGGGSGADDADPLSGEGDRLMGPGAGVIPGTFETVQAVEGRAIDGREAPGGHDAIGGAKPRAVLGGNPPASCRVVEDGFGDRRLESDVAAEVEAVRDVLQIAQDFRLPRIAFGPPPLLLELVGELVGILDAIGIAAGAGIAVPVPGTADAAAPLEDLYREPHPAQAMKHVEAGEACADDDRVHIRRHRGAVVPGLAPCRRSAHGPWRLACVWGV